MSIKYIHIFFFLLDITVDNDVTLQGQSVSTHSSLLGDLFFYKAN